MIVMKEIEFFNPMPRKAISFFKTLIFLLASSGRRGYTRDWKCRKTGWKYRGRPWSWLIKCFFFPSSL
jgi:hypothetical protein